MRIVAAILALTIGLAGSASAQTIERIRETNELKLGFRSDAAPLSFANEAGEASGYTPLLCVGIAQELADRLELPNLEVSFVPVTTENRFEKVAAGEIDLLCGAATITMDRREIVDFSDPVFVDGTVALMTRNADPSMKSLAGKKVGVRAGTTTQVALHNSLVKEGIEAELVPFEDHGAGVEALRNGEIAAYFGDQSILVYQLATKNLGSELRITNQLLTVEKQGLAMARGDTDFRLLIDGIVGTMYRRGAVQRVYESMLPGVEPGMAMRALIMIAPTLP
ncbi:amino acid ABC transporter substrate-binding protein [Tropicimonas sp. IMCC6043]|uniref:amino acid ABC transporter substrate-binding protein n=1 Tax=Tropicimonas sp. IMCC6043 TaxID=2510645 RepID=UPI00101C2F67|nr:amino acid ABC transporter substrate-binding protein [Tropicimonas sp. IMCC6043]RYH10933.1 amino acid ABC transporter substrate-binding protein [Tropicimonas sp. IMCC6043]